MEKLYRLFEDLSRDEIKPKQKLQLETAMDNDEKVKQEFEIYKTVRSDFETVRDSFLEDELKPTIYGLGKDYFREDVKEARFFQGHFYLKIAAVFLLLVISYLAFPEFISSKGKNQILASKYFVPEINVTRSSANDKSIRKYIRANEAFSKGNYQDAVVLYNDILKEQTKYKELIEWNLLLSKLGIQDETYHSMLEQILNDPKHLMYEEAIELKSKLPSN